MPLSSAPTITAPLIHYAGDGVAEEDGSIKRSAMPEMMKILVGGFRLQHCCPDPSRVPGSSIQGGSRLFYPDTLASALLFRRLGSNEILGAGQKLLGPPSGDASPREGYVLGGVAVSARGYQLFPGS